MRPHKCGLFTFLADVPVLAEYILYSAQLWPIRTKNPPARNKILSLIHQNDDATLTNPFQNFGQEQDIVSDTPKWWCHIDQSFSKLWPGTRYCLWYTKMVPHWPILFKTLARNKILSLIHQNDDAPLTNPFQNFGLWYHLPCIFHPSCSIYLWRLFNKLLSTVPCKIYWFIKNSYCSIMQAVF